MKLHLITVGEPKGPCATLWDKYYDRLGHYHPLQTTRVPDKKAYDIDYLLKIAKPQSFRVALAIEGRQFGDSEGLAGFLQERSMEGRDVSLMIGGPEGLPKPVIQQADLAWSLGNLTLPHDLAMVCMVEALYRASTINAGHPYHK